MRQEKTKGVVEILEPQTRLLGRQKRVGGLKVLRTWQTMAAGSIILLIFFIGLSQIDYQPMSKKEKDVAMMVEYLATDGETGVTVQTSGQVAGETAVSWPKVLVSKIYKWWDIIKGGEEKIENQETKNLVQKNIDNEILFGMNKFCVLGQPLREAELVSQGQSNVINPVKIKYVTMVEGGIQRQDENLKQRVNSLEKKLNNNNFG